MVPPPYCVIVPNFFILENLLKSLKNNCVAFLNYHSVGGLIYQRPENNDRFITNYNYLLSKFYQEHTIKNSGNYMNTELSNDEPVADGYRLIMGL